MATETVSPPDSSGLLSDATRMMLEDIARLDGISARDALDRLVYDHWGRRIMEAHNVAYAALHTDPAAWAEELAERAVYDGALADGLDAACSVQPLTIGSRPITSYPAGGV